MTQTTLQSSFKIIKIGNCNSLSGKGNLTYQIACNPDSTIFFRITANSGGGWFSADWISLEIIMSAIGKPDNSLTSYALQGLFKGKSVNTPAFLFAALKKEGLVAIDTHNPRSYLTVSSETFMDEIKILIAPGTDLKSKTVLTGKGATKSSSQILDAIPVLLTAKNTDRSNLKSEANKS